MNTFPTDFQGIAAARATRDGGFVVTWTGSGQDGSAAGVFAQRYASDGARLGDEFQVNTYTTGSQDSSRLSVDGSGFIVVWVKRPAVGSPEEVVAQRYALDGSAVGTEFRIDQRTGRKSFSDVASNADGSFLAAWHDDAGPPPLPDPDVHARYFDAASQPVGGQFNVPGNTTRTQSWSAVSGNGSGLFVVVWRSMSSGDAVLGRRLARGTPVGSEFVVSPAVAGQVFPSVAMSRSGEFVVAYGLTDGSSTGIFARRYDASGAPFGPEFLVNTYTTGAQEFPEVGIDGAGSFVIVWNGAGNGDTNGIFGRRFDAAGAPRGAEFGVNTAVGREEARPTVASDAAGNFVVAWESDAGDGFDDVRARRFGGLKPAALDVDPRDAGGNGVLDPAEVALIRPWWRNENGAAQAFSSRAIRFNGPVGPTYTIVDGVADYGTVPNGAMGSCQASGDCISAAVVGPRPATHWDAVLEERIEPDTLGQVHEWTIHVGGSFADVDPLSPFYRFVETLVHRGVTAGCTSSTYCPGTNTTREQMAVFALVAREGTGYVPPPCTSPLFSDVPASSPFCAWIEELARRGVVGGCGGGRYCPSADVSREQFAPVVLRTLDPALNPPACTTPMFTDVPAASPFCRWVEELARRQVVTGCGGGAYCPAAPVTRDMMGVFISVTFGLTLYGA